MRGQYPGVTSGLHGKPETSWCAAKESQTKFAEIPRLHMLCGKIASGKSTLAARLGSAPGTALLAEDTWLRDVLKATEAAHRLHVFDVSGERCLSRLRARNAAGSHQFAVTDAQFHRFSAHFAVPTAEEGFDLVVQNEAGEAVPEP